MEMARTPTRRLKIFLRDFRMVEATVSLGDGQALTSYFSSRRSYVNLREAHWAGTGDVAAHAVLRVEQVLWAAAPDNDVPLTSASLSTPGRSVELQLDGGLLFRGALVMAPHQRLTDYLESAGAFVPLLRAQLLRSGRPPRQVNVDLGDIVLNQAAVQAVWEVEAPDAAAEAGPAEAHAFPSLPPEEEPAAG
jgi:hypothetical protein